MTRAIRANGGTRAMVSNRTKMDEIDRNLKRFLEVLPELMSKHADDYVLIRNSEIIGYFNSAIDAQIAGNRQFPDQLFSIQQVKEAAEELGRYSYAIPSRPA
jgi:hypothetical protein